MEAMQAYNTGKPAMADEEFSAVKSAVKSKLKENGSSIGIAVSKEPKCYIEVS